MSYDNHDRDDPNAVKYVKKVELTGDDIINGKAINIYAKANLMPLKDFIKWFKTTQK